MVDDVVDRADIDAMVATLDGLWDAPAPIPHLDAARSARGAGRAAAHRAARRAARLIGAGAARAMRAASDWRIHGFHYLNPAARRLFHEPAAARPGEPALRPAGRGPSPPSTS